MQPTLRQVPPYVDRFSITATLSPSCAARMAHTYPPGPVPITIRSKAVAIFRSLPWSKIEPDRCRGTYKGHQTCATAAHGRWEQAFAAQRPALGPRDCTAGHSPAGAMSLDLDEFTSRRRGRPC